MIASLNRFKLVLVLLIAAAAAGCSSRKQQVERPIAVAAPNPLADSSWSEITSAAGTYIVQFSPPPDQLPMNQLFSLEVRIFDAVDRQLVGKNVQLLVDAAMPAHRHGMTTKPKIIATSPGNFRIQGMNLHMSGDWELYFDITRDGVTERAQVTIALE